MPDYEIFEKINCQTREIMAGELEQQRAPSNIMNTFPGQERKKLLRRKKIRYF